MPSPRASHHHYQLAMQIDGDLLKVADAMLQRSLWLGLWQKYGVHIMGFSRAWWWESKGCPPSNVPHPPKTFLRCPLVGPSIWTLLIRTLFACGTPPKNGCLGFQGHPAVGFTAQKKNPWHSSASGTPPRVLHGVFVWFFVEFFRPKKMWGFAKPPTFFLVAAETVTPSRNRTAKKKTSWSGQRRLETPPRLLNEAAEARFVFFLAVSWFLVLDRTCGWWSKFVKIFGSFGAPLKVETSVGFLEFFWLEIMIAQSYRWKVGHLIHYKSGLLPRNLEAYP